MDFDQMRAIVAKDLDLEGVPAEEQQQVVEQFAESALKRVTLALYEKLPEAARQQFIRLGDAGDSAGLLKLFQANIPNLDAFVQSEIKQEIKEFKDFQTS